ncbi:hypothetical protein BHE74_00051640, partial [Ensete ventricosum]
SNHRVARLATDALYVIVCRRETAATLFWPRNVLKACENLRMLALTPNPEQADPHSRPGRRRPRGARGQRMYMSWGAGELAFLLRTFSIPSSIHFFRKYPMGRVLATAPPSDRFSGRGFQYEFSPGSEGRLALCQRTSGRVFHALTVQ